MRRGPYAIDEEINNWLVDGSSLIENPKAIDTGAASPFPAPPPLPSEDGGHGGGRWRGPEVEAEQHRLRLLPRLPLRLRQGSTLVLSYQTLRR